VSTTRSLSLPARVHVAALVVAVIGFLVLLAAGAPEFAPFPPGVVVLLGAALITVLAPRRRWVPLIGAALAVAICIGAFVVYDGTLARLATPSDVVLFGGTVLQMGGVVTAAVSGVVAAVTGPARPAPPVSTASALR
jgi:hypothetical protein